MTLGMHLVNGGVWGEGGKWCIEGCANLCYLANTHTQFIYCVLANPSVLDAWCMCLVLWLPELQVIEFEILHYYYHCSFHAKTATSWAWRVPAHLQRISGLHQHPHSSYTNHTIPKLISKLTEIRI